ncbi:hypothetical protein BIW11_03389 [Tropilaelaps mercedesae]|uniref:Uncharacterized protein n=1 Tax=Tropilaelaps mercedesae TaxID=418985 RepID=A0A1V9XMN3_9ACAR|nr:hypothetical protein BIW11_03389 [Tropilaelaps mercedesae]
MLWFMAFVGNSSRISSRFSLLIGRSVFVTVAVTEIFIPPRRAVVVFVVV